MSRVTLEMLQQASHESRPFWIREMMKAHEEAFTRLVQTAHDKFYAQAKVRPESLKNASLEDTAVPSYDAFLVIPGQDAVIQLCAIGKLDPENAKNKYTGMHVRIHKSDNTEVIDWDLPPSVKTILFETREEFFNISPEQLEFVTSMISTSRPLTRESYLSYRRITELRYMADLG